MKILVLFALVGLLIGVIIAIHVLGVSCFSGGGKIKVGQVWQDKPRKDPFENFEPFKYEVLAIQDGYVQYRITRGGYSDVSSYKKGVFLWGVELIKDVD